MYTVSVLDEKLSFKQSLRARQGDLLLEVFLRNKIVIRHDCGGVCHCTTCHIYIEKGEGFIEEPTKRESDFLKKVAQRKINSRLACQCLLLKGRGEIEVHLPKSDAYLQQ